MFWCGAAVACLALEHMLLMVGYASDHCGLGCDFAGRSNCNHEIQLKNAKKREIGFLKPISLIFVER